VANRVRLLKQVKTGNGWVLAPALFDTKGRIRRDHVRVDGIDELHPEGGYFIEWWQNGRRKREAVGADAWAAADRAQHKLTELMAQRAGLIGAPASPAESTEQITVAAAIDKYQDYIQYHRSLRTFRTYRPILQLFKSHCRRDYIEQVGREDLLDFATHCIKDGQSGKTVHNKLVVISQLMKQHGKAKLLNANDWPSYVDKVRPIYEDHELEVFFKACTWEEEVRFKFYLLSGFRDAEGRFVTWRDIDFKHTAVRVTAKPHWKFQPKNWEEREVPVPQKLTSLLRKFKPADAGQDDPVFPSNTGQPDGSMLEKVKRIACRAGLNCDHCATEQRLKSGALRVNRCAEGEFCTRWFLHKFRHTYATRHLQDGIDIRTLQQWMGHRAIASTMVYLKGLRNKDVQARINKGSLAAFA
jgi:integrase/recombinase XerD